MPCQWLRYHCSALVDWLLAGLCLEGLQVPVYTYEGSRDLRPARKASRVRCHVRRFTIRCCARTKYLDPRARTKFLVSLGTYGVSRGAPARTLILVRVSRLCPPEVVNCAGARVASGVVEGAGYVQVTGMCRCRCRCRL